MKIYDISPTIHKGIAVWPNDTAFSRNVLLDTNDGKNITLSSITTTLHLGAHTDRQVIMLRMQQILQIVP